MIVAFFGHRFVTNRDALARRIKEVILENCKREERIVFYCGGYGDFDALCARVCHSLKEELANCETVLIMPYLTPSWQKKTKDLLAQGLYDSCLYPPLENVPPKFAISRRNEWMVRQSDLLITYIEHMYGGAYQAFLYAQKRKKAVINLASAVK